MERVTIQFNYELPRDKEEMEDRINGPRHIHVLNDYLLWLNEEIFLSMNDPLKKVILEGTREELHAFMKQGGVEL